jgi:tetratricopeptide (TPR) repeat protein
MGCLDEGTVVAFLEGQLAAPERSIVEDHLATCGSCTELLTWAAASDGGRSRAPEGRPFVGTLAPGSRVDRYQILGAVGRGGMGEVYAAYHPDLDRRIALKVVGESGARAPERRARLLREARAIARLSHPNVIAVHDAGTVDDRVYIAMEFVEGETVDAWLRTRPRSWREVVDVFIAAGRGLAAAHAAGIVHRDFKPQNVMIGRDGPVRVMDFGLARVAEEPPDASPSMRDANALPLPATVTKTGAVIGTLAYMSPEQFRGEPLDARADQFSFCVALHEALFGRRPALAHLSTLQNAEAGAAPDIGAAPSWLRAIVSRGLAEQRERRFPSMDALIRFLVKGRAAPRLRAVGAGISLTVLLVALGGWRVARGARMSCAVPEARLGAAWSGREDTRRLVVHRAFTASGRPTAETSWQRVSRLLDEYIGGWSSMYIETCEATHVRGEQSADVLDLRMSCLNDNLDQVRALTNVLASADGAAIGRAVAATHDLTPVSRCADVALLRSAVALPRDQKTLDAVRELRTSLREAQALRDVANFREARERAAALLPRVEATKYAPLLAEVLELIGCSVPTGEDPADTERTLHRALFTAEAARDDVTAALAAVDLIYLVGVDLNRPKEAETWLRLSESILDRLGPGHDRIRAWALNNIASVMLVTGQLERSETLGRQAIALKESALGKDHPDVALSLGGLSSALEEQGRPQEALQTADRALQILALHGDPESDSYGREQTRRGEALVALGRGSEAEAAFSIALKVYRTHEEDMEVSFALHGLGNARLLQGSPASAVTVLEKALRIRERHWHDDYFVAEARFSLARALWETRRDRKRSLNLAREARKTLRAQPFPRREQAVVRWLAEHKPDLL